MNIIIGGTLEIIHDFLSLTGRRMRVGVGDSFSKFIDILSGVPQGSVLGPILFLILINDLPEFIKSLILMFADAADDLKLIANASRFDIFDADLKALERWQEKWQLRFNLLNVMCYIYDIYVGMITHLIFIALMALS